MVTEAPATGAGGTRPWHYVVLFVLTAILLWMIFPGGAGTPAVTTTANPRAAANWVRNEVLRVLNDRKIDIEDYRVTPAMLAQHAEVDKDVAFDRVADQDSKAAGGIESLRRKVTE